MNKPYAEICAEGRNKAGNPSSASATGRYTNPTFSNILILIVWVDDTEPPPTTPLIYALANTPSTTSALEPAVVLTTHIASILFSHLVRLSPQAKSLARAIKPGPSEGSSLFVPADGTPTAAEPAAALDEDEPPQTLLQALSENLSLALLSRSRENVTEKESREWDRLVVGYLTLLSQWLWEDPGSVRDFLDAGGMSVV